MGFSTANGVGECTFPSVAGAAITLGLEGLELASMWWMCTSGDLALLFLAFPVDSLGLPPDFDAIDTSRNVFPTSLPFDFVVIQSSKSNTVCSFGYSLFFFSAHFSRKEEVNLDSKIMRTVSDFRSDEYLLRSREATAPCRAMAKFFRAVASFDFNDGIRRRLLR
jgi:hypothetical protein